MFNVEKLKDVPQLPLVLLLVLAWEVDKESNEEKEEEGGWGRGDGSTIFSIDISIKQRNTSSIEVFGQKITHG